MNSMKLLKYFHIQSSHGVLPFLFAKDSFAPKEMSRSVIFGNPYLIAK